MTDSTELIKGIIPNPEKQSAYSVEALVDFLRNGSCHGLMPEATASAFIVAVQNVLGVLEDGENKDIRTVDRVIEWMNDEGEKNNSTQSLNVYKQRTGIAIEYFLRWKNDPSNSKMPMGVRRRHGLNEQQAKMKGVQSLDGYDTALPIRSGRIIGLTNIPFNLTRAEAKQLSEFIELLVIE